jgi:hypothetical protein
MSARPKLHVDEREKQVLPGDMMKSWLGFIREQLNRGRDEKEFYSALGIYRKALTHFAAKLNGKAVTLPPARYSQIVYGVLMTIRDNGKLDGIKYLPRYVLHCFQEHWKHHGDEYYEEGKALRGTVDKKLAWIAGLPRVSESEAAAAKGEDVVKTLAAVNAVLATPRKRACRGVETGVQKELF